MPALGALAALYIALGFSTGSAATLIALSLTWGMVNHVALTTIVTLLGEAAPSRRGSVMALYSATTYAAGGLATAAAAGVLAVTGYEVVALGAAASVAVAAVVFRGLGRRGPRSPATP